MRIISGVYDNINELNEYYNSDKLLNNKTLYHLSEENLHNKILYPRNPNNYLTRNGYEDDKIKRISFSTSIDFCLRALGYNLKGRFFNVYVPDKECKIYKPNKSQVPDAEVTHEVWVKEPVKLKYIGTIKVGGSFGKGYSYEYGNNKAHTYDWKWEWINRDENNYNHDWKKENSSKDKDKYYGMQMENTTSLIGDLYNNTILLEDNDQLKNNYKKITNENFKKKSGKKFKFINIKDNKSKVQKYLSNDKDYNKTYKKYIDEISGEIVIDEEYDTIAGYIFIINNFITPVYVFKEYRGYGLGDKLVKDAVDKYNAKRLWVYKDNVIAINLYKKYGFKTYIEDDEPTILMATDKKYIKDIELDENEDLLLNNKMKEVNKMSTIIINELNEQYRNDKLLVSPINARYVYVGTNKRYRDYIDKEGTLFVTPYKRIASLFTYDRERLRDGFSKRIHSCNIGYDQWNFVNGEGNIIPDTVNLRVEGDPNYKNLDFVQGGFIYKIDASKYKLYRYPWMDEEKEAIILDDKVKISGIEDTKILFRVRGCMKLDESKLLEDYSMRTNDEFKISILSESDIQLLLEATGKSGSSVLVQELYPTVNANLNNPNNVKELSFAIAKYIDRNSQILYDIGIAKKIVFLESDKNVIYDVCGLTKEDIRHAIKKSPYIKTSWKILNEPLNTAAVLAIRYFTIQKNEGMVQNLLIYYSMYFYASLHHKYLKFDANENIMEYTINNLSNKFKIKQLGSLFETIKHIVMTSHETYKQDLIRGEDGDLAKYVSSIKVRLNDFMKNVTNEYMKNHKEKRFMNFDSDDYSEDNFHIADNTSYAIKRLTESSLMRLMTYGADMQMAKLAANLSQVSQNEIRNVIINLTDDDSEKIMRLTELILQLYLVDGANTVDEVRGKKFLVTCMEIYKKSNTNDKNILEIKQILDEWLKKYSPKYRQTNREATLSNFRRSIFIYFVLHIQQSSR